MTTAKDGPKRTSASRARDGRMHISLNLDVEAAKRFARLLNHYNQSGPRLGGYVTQTDLIRYALDKLHEAEFGNTPAPTQRKRGRPRKAS